MRFINDALDMEIETKIIMFIISFLEGTVLFLYSLLIFASAV